MQNKFKYLPLQQSPLGSDPEGSLAVSMFVPCPFFIEHLCFFYFSDHIAAVLSLKGLRFIFPIGFMHIFLKALCHSDFWAGESRTGGLLILLVACRLAAEQLASVLLYNVISTLT